MSEDLLPCPFCGAEPQLKDVTTAGDRLPPVYAAVCPECQITVMLPRWNRRTPPTATKELLDHLRARKGLPGGTFHAFLAEWGE
jgi:hypothetical protein